MTPITTASRAAEKSRIVAFAKLRRVEQLITSFLIARLGEGKIMELKKNNFRIFFHSFESFYGGKKSSFPCLKVKHGGNEIDRREYLFFSIISKLKIFIPPKIGRN